MATTFTGMDIDAVLALGKQLEKGASDIDSLVKSLSGKIDSAPWKGQDYETFKNEWHGRFEPSMKNASAALKGIANTAKKNAEEQRQTSSR